MRRTIGGFRPGGILLLHDADGSGAGDDRSQTAEAVPEIVERAHAAGYELVTVSELAERAPAKRTAPWRIVAGLALFAVLLELALRSRRPQHRHRGQHRLVVGASRRSRSTCSRSCSRRSSGRRRSTRSRASRASTTRTSCRRSSSASCSTRCCPRASARSGAWPCCSAGCKLVGTDVPTPTLAGSVVAEQIVLAIALVVIMLLQLPFVNVPARFEHMILAFGGVIIVRAAGGDRRSRRSRAGAARTPRRDLAFTRGQQALAMLHPIARGMQQRPDGAAPAAHRAGALLARPRSPGRRRSRGIYAALAAADIHPTIGRAGLVFLVSTLVQLFPFWPGNIGLFQAAVAQVLVQAYPIDFPHALAFAVGLQVIEVSLGVGLGFWFLSREGLSLAEVRGLRGDD